MSQDNSLQPRRKRWPYPRDAEGRYLCRCGCGKHPPKGRRYWFSDACVELYRSINDPGYIRRKLLERDKGVCAGCGLDTLKFWRLKVTPIKRQHSRTPDRYERRFREGGQFIEERYERVRNIWSRWRERWKAAMQARIIRLKASGWNLSRDTSFDCDHIIPVAEGGGQCDLANYQSLCHPCHRRKTTEQAKRKAAARRELKLSQKELAR